MMSTPESSKTRFAPQESSTEGFLKDQTVGLVQLDDFRKRRREAADVLDNDGRGSTPNLNEGDTDGISVLKRKKRKSTRRLLSFDDEDVPVDPRASQAVVHGNDEDLPNDNQSKFKKTRNHNLPIHKAVTKASLAAETAERERLRAEFVKVQEQVRDTDIVIPFVFYDGSSLPGGIVKVKKGEHIWLFLEKCRKLGAEIGVGSEGGTEAGAGRNRVEGKKSWARIGVDDLMLIRGELIIPHHYEFHYFILNKIADPSRPEKVLFDYTASLTEVRLSKEQSLLRHPKDEMTEGQNDDPSYTKVVDRRWYEKNKHIYPASLWREYKAGKEYEDLLKGRRDAQGNSFFFP